jgi:hypothetical protein
MTCIVGIQYNNQVWIGGDSAGVAGYKICYRADEKVFIKDNFIFGFTSSFRMGQLIRYKLSIPKIKEDQDIDEYLHVDFLDSVIQCFKSNGYAIIENNGIQGGVFLFGFKGRLYQVNSDFQIARQIDDYDAVGCGEDFALGSLYNENRIQNTGGPKYKIIRALECAEYFSSGVSKPFHVLSL